MRLVLSGGGDAKQTKELDKFFVSILPKNKKILYIPIAMRGKYTFKECLNWIKSCLNPLGFDGIEMWTNLKNIKYKDLQNFGAIYIGGGNTFSLLNDFRKMNFINPLKQFIKNNGLIYGGSAGAIILGKSIKTAGFGGDVDRNIVKLKDLSGLNLIVDYAIQCHYTKRDNKKLKELKDKFDLKTISLPEGCGLYVENNKIIVKGKGSVFVIDDRKNRKIENDEEIN